MDTKANYIISDSLSDRITIYKFLLTIMVVYLHSYRTVLNFTTGNIVFDIPEWLEIIKFMISQSISRCAVPAFFFLSAIFLYRKPFSWKDNLKKKIKTLLVPYLILNTFWIFVFWGGAEVPVLHQYFSNPDHIASNWGIYGWLKAYGLVGYSKGPMLYPLWFVRNLFVLNVFAVVIKKIIDYSPKIFFGILLILWFLPVPFVDDGIKTTICFWSFGYLFVYYKVDATCFDNRKLLLGILYSALLVADCILRVNSVVGYLIHNAVCIVGIPFWFVCATRFSSDSLKKRILYLGSFSFCIYVFHENSLTVLIKILGRLLPTTAFFQFMKYVFIPIIIIAGCIVVGALLKNYTSKLYGLVTGGRQ